MNRMPKLLAFYLTQYHPIKENNEWWEKGFTEWTNVTKASPLFRNHYQPHLPTDLGFYDLRVRETRHEQIALAKQYGIDGFCYHYYWFSGKRLLERPLFEMLADKESDMPFCLCWANENWTRRWDGAENQILMQQRYTQEDDENFIKDAAEFLLDERYISLDGKKFIIIYCPQNLPNPRRTIQTWKKVAHELGIGDLHICAALTFGNLSYKDYGCDSGVEFPPHNLTNATVLNNNIDFHSPFYGNIFSYSDVAREYLTKAYPEPHVFRTVFPSWDNSARRKDRANVMISATPKNYQTWLQNTIANTKERYKDADSFVFINAWNEWAEGCHLEPDRKYGHQYLEATYNAKHASSEVAEFPDNEESTHYIPHTLSAYIKQFYLSPTGFLRARAVLILNHFPRAKAMLKRIFSLFRVVKSRIRYRIYNVLRACKRNRS